MSHSTFSTQKEASLSHQVIKLARLLNETGLSNVRDRFSVPELRQAHLDLFAHIDFEGTSVSEIAKRKGVSKQAASKLVAELTEMGILYSKPSPSDARMKLICFQTSGPLSIQEGFKELQKIDEKLRRRLGKQKYATTLESMNSLVEMFLA